LVALFALTLALEPYSFDKNEYECALDYKLKAQKDVPSPRVLIFGGSNGAYGINSTQLSKHFGLPFYNMCVIAWLGIPNQLYQIQQIARPNDVILLTLEYAYTRTSIPRQAVLKLKAPNYTKVDLRSIGSYLVFLHCRIVLAFDGWASIHVFNNHENIDFKRADGFNSVGDFETHLTSKSRYKGDVNKMDMIDIKDVSQEITQFMEAMNKKGIKVYFVPQSLCRSVYNLNPKRIDTFENQWAAFGVRSVCHPRDMVWPDSLFFDSPHHLTAQGRDLRTAKLEKYLAPFLSKPSTSLANRPR
jgi:hypothetical protein